LQIQKVSQGSKVLSISATRLSNINLFIPVLKEQAKIANFLTALDDKITQTQAERDAVKQYKQGLLQ
jgi:type I restriction enzyme S subunit